MAPSCRNIVVRTDASLKIGTGHVMRCLTLAEELVKRNVEVRFLCRLDEGNLIDDIRNRGFNVLGLPPGISNETEDAVESLRLLDEGPATDLLVVDHYDLGESWEKLLKPETRHLMVIDDLANRRHECDLLLDQNYFSDADTRYAGLLPESSQQLLGPSYALLRPEFLEARREIRRRDASVQRIMIFFGGSDRTNVTTKVLEALADAGAHDIAVDVIIGVNNSHGKKIEEAATAFLGAVCHRAVGDMAALMLSADLYIGAAGGTTWERCCLGLPSLVVTVADNQVRPVQDLNKLGVLRYIGPHEAVTHQDIARTYQDVAYRLDELQSYSHRSMELVDGLGAKRCADAVTSQTGLEINNNLRTATVR